MRRTVLHDWRPTKEEARGSLDVVTFLVALVWFGFTSANVPIPERVKAGIDALLAFAIVLSRYAR
jgi:hypothetical protein